MTFNDQTLNNSKALHVLKMHVGSRTNLEDVFILCYGLGNRVRTREGLGACWGIHWGGVPPFLGTSP